MPINKSAKDCIKEIYAILTIFEEKKDKLEEECDASNKYIEHLKRVRKMIILSAEILVLFTGLFFIISQKELLAVVSTEYILFGYGFVALIIRIISSLGNSNKSKEYNQVIEYYNKIEELVDKMKVDVWKTENYDTVFEVYLEIKKIIGEMRFKRN